MGKKRFYPKKTHQVLLEVKTADEVELKLHKIIVSHTGTKGILA